MRLHSAPGAPPVPGRADRRVEGRCVPTGPGTELVLVRHGRGWCNEAGVIGGRFGCRGLSDAGRRESARLAGRLAAMAGRRPFDVVLSSPRPRVLECARIVASRLGQPVVVVERLAGQEFGSADGRRWERVTEEFGGPPIHHPDRPVADGAEPWNVYADRVLAVLTEILADRAGQRVCVVGHGKTTGLAGALLSGAPDPRSAAAALVVSHGALAVWRQEGDAWHLVEDGGP